ncbi:MAG: hypothetical protein KA165_18815, partial [Saprospiraceae bacterium]|nr:hypothetical protein [Saprospiraceae bacterium]
MEEPAGEAESAAPPPPPAASAGKSGSERAPGATPGVPGAAILQNGFVDLAALDPTIRLDIRYATADH